VTTEPDIREKAHSPSLRPTFKIIRVSCSGQFCEPADFFALQKLLMLESAKRRTFACAAEAFEFIGCEPISTVVELENAVVMVFTRGVSRATGRSVLGMLAHFIRFRDGKIVELREFADSLHAAEQALGRELIEGF
jgi:hypothetical protein